MSNTDEYARQIEAEIPGAQAKVEGGGGKFEATVVTDQFEGKNMLARHRLVNNALKDRIQSGEIHALSIQGYTPSEWEAKSG